MLSVYSTRWHTSSFSRRTLSYDVSNESLISSIILHRSSYYSCLFDHSYKMQRIMQNRSLRNVPFSVPVKRESLYLNHVRMVTIGSDVKSRPIFRYFFMTQQPLWVYASSMGFLDNTDTPQLVEFFRTGDSTVAETCTWRTEHSQSTDTHATGGIRSRNPSKREVEGPRLRPSDCLDGRFQMYVRKNYIFCF